AIEFLRRSGEPRGGKSKWEFNGEMVLGVLVEIIRAMSAKQLALGLPADLAQMNYAMVPLLSRDDQSQWRLNIPAEAREAEFKRIFERRCDPKYRNTAVAIDLRQKISLVANAAGADGKGWLDLNNLLQ